MTKPLGVLFDCDGVLVDSEPISEPIILSRLASVGVTTDPATLQKMFLGGTIDGIAASARASGADVPDDWVQGTYDAMFAELRKGTPLIEGVIALLDDLDAAQIPYAVCSNGPLPKMDITLGGAGIIDRFKGRIYSAHSHAKAKPAPDLYLYAALQMGLAPQDCVVVEDSAPGVRAAVAAEMRCIGYAAAGHAKELAALGAELAMTMEDARTLLGLR